MNCMSGEIFVDTNVLAYAFDESEKEKREIAKKIVKQITSGELKGVVSNQVLAEFFTVLTKKITVPIEKQTAQTIVNGFIDSNHWKKINYTEKTIGRAIETVCAEKTSFWDALIAETMIENQVYKILTENIKDFQTKQIIAENPFK